MQTLHNKIVTTAARSWGLQLSELLCASSGEGAAASGDGRRATGRCGSRHHEIGLAVYAQGCVGCGAEAEAEVMA